MSLKHVVILDVLTIALGFVLRAWAGAEAVEVEVSHWLLLLTLLGALVLGLGKRRAELVALARRRRRATARILAEYSPYLLDQMISVVTASTLLAYAFYTIDPETVREVRHRPPAVDDSVSAVRHFPISLSRAPARRRRQSVRDAR